MYIYGIDFVFKRKHGSGNRKTWYYSVILVYVVSICLKDLLNNKIVHLKGPSIIKGSNDSISSLMMR